MSSQNLIRFWTDEAYRRSLPAEAEMQLPANPVGSLATLDRDLQLFEQKGSDDPMARATPFTCTACATHQGCGCL